MKPITLKLAGLQSYREPQTIDFTELCETGLFGILDRRAAGNRRFWTRLRWPFTARSGVHPAGPKAS
ncbi:hypothetical protein HMSSN139_68250 [Paenibacillus sp. HMSSN-139]|nr:hypothetical protein HMSSN139_68250 [Paenibacillus sp. HMSSN-139]